MNRATFQSLSESLETAIKLAQDANTQADAHAAFNQLYESVRYETPELATLLQMLWREYAASQRSANFWQELCQVEKHLSERITENHLQLRQNYLRLIQEQ